MNNILIKSGWLAGGGLFIGAAVLLAMRVAVTGAQTMAPVQGTGRELAFDKGSPAEISVALSPDTFEVPNDLRDVFSFKAASDAETSPAVSHDSFRIVALIAGSSSGAVLEDRTNGQTVFLSEGETKDDVFLVQVGKSGAQVRVHGQELLLAAPSRME
jgi:hypothetical protein